MQTVTAMLLYYTNVKHCDILQFYEVCFIFSSILYSHYDL